MLLPLSFVVQAFYLFWFQYPLLSKLGPISHQTLEDHVSHEAVFLKACGRLRELERTRLWNSSTSQEPGCLNKNRQHGMQIYLRDLQKPQHLSNEPSRQNVRLTSMFKNNRKKLKPLFFNQLFPRLAVLLGKFALETGSASEQPLLADTVCKARKNVFCFVWVLAGARCLLGLRFSKKVGPEYDHKALPKWEIEICLSLSLYILCIFMHVFKNGKFSLKNRVFLEAKAVCFKALPKKDVTFPSDQAFLSVTLPRQFVVPPVGGSKSIKALRNMR